MQITRAQFFNGTGQPLAAGCVNFFAAGTSTPQAIYADNGGVNQLPNPLTLDAAGEASVWLSNTAYRIVANTGVTGQPCSLALGTQLWVEDNKNAFSIINGGSNYIVASGTTDPVGTQGELAYRTDIPCFRGFTTLWDCFVRLGDTQTLTNKTFDVTANVLKTSTNVAGHYLRNNGTQYVDSAILLTDVPGTSTALTNATGTAPITNALVSLNGPPTSIGLTPTSATGGVVGIWSGSVVQQSGLVTCIFDGGTTANDYVQISTGVAGDCHDAGGTFPTSGQVIGRVLSNQVFPGAYQMLLFGPEIKGTSTLCTNAVPVTVSNTGAQTSLLSCFLPGNTLSSGSLLRIDLTGIESTASAMTITLQASIAGGTPCTAISGTTSVVNNVNIHYSAQLAVLTSGAGGTANWTCEYDAGSSGGGFAGGSNVTGPTFGINTTLQNALLIQVTMSVVNAGNSVTGQLLKAVVF